MEHSGAEGDPSGRQPMTRSAAITLSVVTFFAAAGLARAGSVDFVRKYDVGPGNFVDPDNDTATDISGFACTAVPARHCLATNDENQTAQFAAVEDGKLQPGMQIRLIGKNPSPATRGKAPVVTTCPDGNKKFKEFDGEAIAYAVPFFYVIGSHGCGRNNNAFRLSSFIVARIRVDAQARPVDTQENPLPNADIDKAVETTYRMSDLLQRAPEVSAFFGKSLNDAKGLNIEGLAVVGDRLLAGLRAPSIGDRAFIIGASVADLFASGEAPSSAMPEVLPVELGPNAGIRDITVLRDRLLILAGPTQEQADIPYSLVLLEPKAGAKASPIGPIPDVVEDGKRAKAESITVLDAQDDVVRVLIMFDGPKNGGPREYRVSLK